MKQRMKPWIRRMSALALIGALAVTSVVAQQRAEDRDEYYKKWIEQDVKYIISEEEADVFNKLETNDERDQFIEQFWFRRDPDPSTAVNEFRTEHFRRIAYSNEHFHSGIPGWRTDRGLIYIRFGAPTSVEKQPEGGFYARKGYEGGGFTSVHPFEIWFYNHIDGVGDGVEIEFVDQSRTNEYKLARDAHDKDALLHVPGVGLTDAEAFGLQSRYDRLRTRFLANQDAKGAADPSFQTLRIRDLPFERLQQLYNLQRAPDVEFGDLQKIVRVRVSYDNLPFEFRTDQIQISENVWLIPLTAFFRNADLTFKKVPESPQTHRAEVNIYGEVKTLGGRTAYVFEESIKQDIAENQLNERREQSAVFQKRFPLRPGRYKISLVAQDVNSGQLSTVEKSVVVARQPVEELTSSSVILTDRVIEASLDSTVGDPFVFGKFKVVPSESNRFPRDKPFVQAYFEVYNLELDQATLEASPKVELALFGEKGMIFDYTPLIDEFEYVGDRLLIYKTLPFGGLASGNYEVRFRVTDLIADRSLSTATRFSLLPAQSDSD